MLPGGAWAESLAPMDHADDEANYKACMAEAGHDPEDCRWHLKFDNCLLTDRRGPNHDGEEFCIQDGTEMSEAEIDAWYLQDVKTQAIREAKVHHARNEATMAQCNRMADTPAVNWQAVAQQRGVAATIDDCVRASAELAKEGVLGRRRLPARIR